MLKFEIPTLDGVDGALKDFYAETPDGNFRLQVDGVDQRFEAEKAKFTKSLEPILESERAAVVRSGMLASLISAGANADGLDLLPSQFDRRVKIETVNGVRVAKITMADGKTPMVGTGKDGMATFADLALEAKRKFPSQFGAKIDGKPNGAKAIRRADFEALPPFDRAAKMRDGFQVVD